MKHLKHIFIFILVLVLSLSLVACKKKVNEEYKDKVVQSIEDGNPMTYQQIVKELGESSNDTLSLYNVSSGYVIWFNNCKNVDEAKKKTEAGKEVYYLFIYFEDYKATTAMYKEYSENGTLW